MKFRFSIEVETEKGIREIDVLDGMIDATQFLRKTEGIISVKPQVDIIEKDEENDNEINDAGGTNIHTN